MKLKACIKLQQAFISLIHACSIKFNAYLLPTPLICCVVYCDDKKKDTKLFADGLLILSSEKRYTLIYYLFRCFLNAAQKQTKQNKFKFLIQHEKLFKCHFLFAHDLSQLNESLKAKLAALGVKFLHLFSIPHLTSSLSSNRFSIIHNFFVHHLKLDYNFSSSIFIAIN